MTKLLATFWRCPLPGHGLWLRGHECEVCRKAAERERREREEREAKEANCAG